jgi:hypothetical protein
MTSEMEPPASCVIDKVPFPSKASDSTVATTVTAFTIEHTVKNNPDKNIFFIFHLFKGKIDKQN